MIICQHLKVKNCIYIKGRKLLINFKEMCLKTNLIAEIKLGYIKDKLLVKAKIKENSK